VLLRQCCPQPLLPAGADEISNFSKQVWGFGMRSKFIRIHKSNRGDPLLLKGFSVHCAVSQDCDKVDTHARPSLVPFIRTHSSGQVLQLLRVCGASVLREQPLEDEVSNK
jgi:hypothetical protein